DVDGSTWIDQHVAGAIDGRRARRVIAPVERERAGLHDAEARARMAVPAEVPARGNATLGHDDGRVTLRPEVHLPVTGLDVEVALGQDAGADCRVAHTAG